VNAPRAGFIGETVWAARWAAWMAHDFHAFRKCWSFDSDPDEHFPLLIVLHDMRARYRVDQRAAAVAASLVTWLGTNCGRAVLLAGDRIAKTHAVRHPYLAVWADDNMRQRGINRGIRVLEYLLTPEYGNEAKEIAKPTAVDYEVCEHVICWLEEPLGQQFVAECRKEVDTLLADERRKEVEKHEAYLQSIGLRSPR
jgi:hypothetical protein